MRKQVQKERCTKIMLTKCKAVCCLYDKVQLAAAKMLDAEKCQSAKPALGATLQTAKSRTMAAVTQATTAIISSIKFKLCAISIKTACYRITK